MRSKTIPALAALFACLGWWSPAGAQDPARGPAAEAGGFAPLLARLPPDSHLVLLASPAQAKRTWDGIFARLEKSPLFAKHPELGMLLAQQRGMLKAGLASLEAKMGFSPLDDLEQVAVGLVLAGSGPPGMVAVATGRFPDDVLERMGGTKALTIGSHQVFDLDEQVVGAVAGRTLVVANRARMEEALAPEGGEVPAKLLGRFAGLDAPCGEDFLLRLRFALPAWMHELARSEDARLVRTLLGSLERVSLEVDRNLTIVMTCKDQAGTGRAELFLRGWKEMMLGGAYMWRAYALLLLGFDLGAMPGLPPPVQKALSDREALAKTLDLFFPEPTEKPVLDKSGLRVSLTASPQMIQGSLFLTGILSAVAIPAFISYIQKSRQAADVTQMRNIEQALDMYRVEHGRYPTTKEGLDTLVKNNMLMHAPVDAYDNPYRYESSGPEHFTLRALGADGKPGGSGPDRDREIKR